MSDALRLDTCLDQTASQLPALTAACRAVEALAGAARQISHLLARGPLSGDLGAIIGESLDGDGQKALDAMTHAIVRDAVIAAGAAAFASEEAAAPEWLDPAGEVAVAVDPLDGSSNIDTLAPVGTIFSILPARHSPDADAASPFLQTGRRQLAAGFFIYGPRTALAVTFGNGTRIFTLDPVSGAFLAPAPPAAVPPATREYAINGSNLRHWEEPIRDYIAALKQGRSGPRGVDFNTRWLASMVGDAFRILGRGGIYLYPADGRQGYEAGRLRLVYEASPIAFLMEQAGALATDGRTPILDLQPTHIHQRCPLVFGSADEVRRVAQAYDTAALPSSPLFRRRSLFRSASSAAEFFA